MAAKTDKPRRVRRPQRGSGRYSPRRAVGDVPPTRRAYRPGRPKAKATLRRCLTSSTRVCSAFSRASASAAPRPPNDAHISMQTPCVVQLPHLAWPPAAPVVAMPPFVGPVRRYPRVPLPPPPPPPQHRALEQSPALRRALLPLLPPQPLPLLDTRARTHVCGRVIATAAWRTFGDQTSLFLLATTSVLERTRRRHRSAPT